jgi:phage baseplate assembly protein V
MSDNISIINAIRKKLFLLLGRGIVKTVGISGNIQRIQVTALKEEIISDMERMQNYGFESYPRTETEATLLFINGNRDQGVVICVTDRDARTSLPSMAEGDVCVYDDRGNTIILNASGMKLTDLNGNIITMKASMVDINGNLTVDI